ncbi:MAG: hypothetical protein ABL308_08065 [Oceanicaulis sp.]
MKRDEIERLKHNARLDVRMPDQLKDEFLARCREEGVSSGAVIRSMVVDYLLAQPRRWPDMTVGVKEAITKRAEWLLGGLGGAATAGLAAAGLLFAPLAGAEDYVVDFDLALQEATDNELRSNRIETTVRLTSGEPLRFELPHARSGSAAEFAIELTASPCAPAPERACPENGVAIGMVITRLSDDVILSSPRLIVAAGQPAQIEVGHQPGVQILVNLQADTVAE